MPTRKLTMLVTAWSARPQVSRRKTPFMSAHDLVRLRQRDEVGGTPAAAGLELRDHFVGNVPGEHEYDVRPRGPQFLDRPDRYAASAGDPASVLTGCDVDGERQQVR